MIPKSPRIPYLFRCMFFYSVFDIRRPWVTRATIDSGARLFFLILPLTLGA